MRYLSLPASSSAPTSRDFVSSGGESMPIKTAESAFSANWAWITIGAASTSHQQSSMKALLFVLFLSLYPLLGESCSCAKFSGRSETLAQGICARNAQVYSGVVVSATCTCSEADLHDCREVSYSAIDDSYAVEIINRVNYTSYDADIKTCREAENILAPGSYIHGFLVVYYLVLCVVFTGITLERPVEPNITVEEGYYPLVCPFNDYSNYDYEEYISICMYSVRVTEVFIGNYTVSNRVLLLSMTYLPSYSIGNPSKIQEFSLHCCSSYIEPPQQCIPVHTHNLFYR